MQKRYQIFVSSTYEDLKEERSKVITALLNIGHIPCGMEYFPAADEDAWGCIERLIPQCDYYVVLVAGKYGSIAHGDTKSYTHREYELAVKHGIPVLALLHKDPTKLPHERCEGRPTTRRKLAQFRGLVEKKLCRYWASAEQIPGELLASITQQIDRFPRTGWVRANEVASDEAKNEIITLRKQLETSTRTLERLEKKQSEEDQKFSSGDDAVRLKSFFTSNLNSRFRNNRTPIVEFEGHFYVNTTWNQILRLFALEQIEVWTTEGLKTSICNAVGKVAQSMPLFKKWPLVYSILDVEEIHKIEIQLSALGLAVMKNSEWVLTQKGIVAAHRQLALRKGETEALASLWCGIQKVPKTKIRTKTIPAREEEWT
jgi:hypothetical protein